MKKILFLLLLSVASYGQATFDEGIQLSGNQKTTTAPRVILQETDGVLNYQDTEVFSGNSAGAISGFAITDNGNGTANIASGQALLRATNSETGVLQKYTIPAVTNLTLTDNANNYVLANYNGGNPTLTVTTDPTQINGKTTTIVYVIARVGNTLHYLNLAGANVDSNGKLRARFLNTEAIKRAQGMAIGFANRNISVTAGLSYSGLIPIQTTAFNTATGSTFTNFFGTTRQTGQTQINNTQYNNNGVLTTMPNNSFRTDYVYVLANNPSKLYVIMGGTSATLASARAVGVPSSLPVELQYLGVLVGRTIIAKDATAITEVSSAFDTVFANNGVTNYSDLAGLPTIDQTLIDGSTNAVSGNAVFDGLAGKLNTPTGLTTNYLPKWNGSGFGNSQVFDNGTNVGIGTNLPQVSKLHLKYDSVENRALRLEDAFGVYDIISSGAGLNHSIGLFDETNGQYRLLITPSGNTLFGTTTDNGVDKVQVNGSGRFSGKISTGTGIGEITLGSGFISFYNASASAKYIKLADDSSTINAITFTKTGSTAAVDVNGNITASPAISPNHVVVKSQLDAFVPSGTVNLTGNQTIAGIKTFSSPPVVPNAVNANEAVNKGQLDAVASSGVYTPILTNLANTSARTLVKANYIRIQNIVTVYVHFTTDVIAANIDTTVTITLPINKTDVSLYELGGGFGRANTSNTNDFTVRMSNISGTGDSVRLVFKPTASGTNIISASFSYNIN